jgi:two-component system, NtrC family, sensor kinase
MKGNWLFKRIDLSLRAEVIINISLLMLAAILLIGFTVTRVSEKNILQEKVRDGERMVQEVQSLIDFLGRDRREAASFESLIHRDGRDYLLLFVRKNRVSRVVVADLELGTLFTSESEKVGRRHESTLLADAIRTGQVLHRFDTAGGPLLTRYNRLDLYAPLWWKGKAAGGLQVEVPVADVAAAIHEFQKVILVSIMLDAAVLIIFGSFLLSRVLVKPVKDLARLTQRVSQGDLDETLEVTSRNEIGQLIDSFNRMIVRLKEQRETLEEHLVSLETAHRQLRETQEELLRSEKLASIGRFAAGVAHEVGNPLGAILGYTSILQSEGVGTEEALDYLKRIEGEIGRIDRIVRELLDFARPSRFEVKPLEVNRVIENTLSLLAYQKDFKRIATRLDLDPDLPAIRGDEAQLSQVLINMILNAVDAMPEGGTLTLRTTLMNGELAGYNQAPSIVPQRRRNDPAESDYSHLRKADALTPVLGRFAKPPSWVLLQITDTGSGIRPEDLDRIFDPFFTTKAPDKGTGLGLSISLRIIESMGGEIRVQSDPGRGTTFDLYFPPAEGDRKETT